jgi:hypothetical protein
LLWQVAHSVQNMHPGLLWGIGLSWYLPSPRQWGQTEAWPGIAPVPPQPLQTWQKMQPGPCGMVLRWTLPEPPQAKQALAAGATGMA